MWRFLYVLPNNFCLRYVMCSLMLICTHANVAAIALLRGACVYNNPLSYSRARTAKHREYVYLCRFINKKEKTTKTSEKMQ